MTRKEFLSVVTALFGLALLRRLSFGAGANKHETHDLISYGNNVYGGRKNL